MLPAEERLRSRRDFAKVYERKKSWANLHLVLYIRIQEQTGANVETRRFGFSVSKKVGRAHDRNLVKRRLREICRLHGESWKRGFDAVLVVRNESAKATYAELEAATLQLIRRAGLLNRAPEKPTVTVQESNE